MTNSIIDKRFRCPCCGYPTLSEKAAYDICELCNWEDDGQDDPHADEVWGGPNSDYSLTEARQNFKKHRVMYAPKRDQRIGGADSEAEWKTKGDLMSAFESLSHCNQSECETIEREIKRLEKMLEDETNRIVRRI